MQENCLEEFLRMLAGMSFGEERDNAEDPEDDEVEDEKHPRVKKACATVLGDMRREIHSLERALAVLNAKREALIEEHNALVDEVKSMAKEPRTAGSTEVVQHPEQPGDTPQPNPQSEEEEHEEKHQCEEEQPASELKLDGLSRLERLSLGLDHALKVLDGSKMAFHFKAIKQLRLDLIELANAEDKPDEERIVELENGLKHAVEVLSASPTAANSKTMRQLWGDLILVLKPESQPKQ